MAIFSISCASARRLRDAQIGDAVGVVPVGREVAAELRGVGFQKGVEGVDLSE